LLAAFGAAYHRPTEWQRIGNQMDAAFVFTWSDFVKVYREVTRHEPTEAFFSQTESAV